MSQAAGMQPSLRSSIWLIVLWLAGINSSTLRLHPGYTLPQNTGFFTIEANEDLAAGDGAGSAAPVQPLAGRGGAEGGWKSGFSPLHRSRRSSGDSATPKVYGQVMLSSSAALGFTVSDHASPHAALSLQGWTEEITQASVFPQTPIISGTLKPRCPLLRVGEKGGSVTRLTSTPGGEIVHAQSLALPGVFSLLSCRAIQPDRPQVNIHWLLTWTEFIWTPLSNPPGYQRLRVVAATKCMCVCGWLWLPSSTAAKQPGFVIVSHCAVRYRKKWITLLLPFTGWLAEDIFLKFCQKHFLSML